MTITRAIEHLKWKYGNKWNPTQTDADALNTIIKFTEDKHKQQIQDYHLFAKLYIMVYAQYLERYKATIFDDIPRKELSKLLDKPIELFIERFTQRLNDSELYSLFEELNIEASHPALKNQNQKDQETDVLEKSIKNKDNLDRLMGGVFDIETVEENLVLQINNVINAI